MIKSILQRFGVIPSAFSPHLVNKVNFDQFCPIAAEYFDMDVNYVKQALDRYTALHLEKGYAERFGESKTLCFEEAFLLYLEMCRRAPVCVVEIGTQHGKSTRRILDMATSLGISCKFVCFDIFDEVKFFEPDEAELRIHDVTKSFKKDVLDALHPDLIYLDARPYHLLDTVIRGVIEHNDCVLAVHDCGPGLCNLDMKRDPADPNVTSDGGIWERHVLANVFGISNPLDGSLDNLKTKSHWLRIFPTRHGLAVIRPQK